MPKYKTILLNIFGFSCVCFQYFNSEKICQPVGQLGGPSFWSPAGF